MRNARHKLASYINSRRRVWLVPINSYIPRNITRGIHRERESERERERGRREWPANVNIERNTSRRIRDARFNFRLISKSRLMRSRTRNATWSDMERSTSRRLLSARWTRGTRLIGRFVRNEIGIRAKRKPNRAIKIVAIHTERGTRPFTLICADSRWFARPVPRCVRVKGASIRYKLSCVCRLNRI